MRIIVDGSRDVGDNAYDIVETIMDNIFGGTCIEIISGGANGIDKIGERYAFQKNLKLTVFNAKWDEHGKSAGYKRNVEMANYGDFLVAFWDGKSRGTKHMIDTIGKLNKECFVVYI